jgi:hypothetical protein
VRAYKGTFSFVDLLSLVNSIIVFPVQFFIFPLNGIRFGENISPGKMKRQANTPPQRGPNGPWITRAMLFFVKKPEAPQKSVYDQVGKGMGFKAGPSLRDFP